MAKPSSRTVFVCQQCGKEYPKWLGRCPDCQGWNTFVEKIVVYSKGASNLTALPASPVWELSQINSNESPRLLTSFGEFNRVLGGGLVPGALVLLSGDPGIGKSTLLLQIAAMAAAQGKKIAYISGEESVHQVKLRADRLAVDGKGLYLLCETNLEAIVPRMEELAPHFAIVDSIQSVYLDEAGGAPGSVVQIRECTLRLMRWCKSSNIPVLITGQVTKEGTVAGPRALEHIVDVVLYLEGDPFSAYRILRSVKNRFGSTNEVGVFEMRGQGLVEVSDPSQVFLSSRSRSAIGSSVVPVLEGTRPLLVEIQALTAPTSFSLPRRTANGIDLNRLLLLAAVLSRRVGIRLSSQDIIINVVGGLRIDEPAADLAVALSIASSFHDQEIDRNLAVLGEVGLSGEVRAVPQVERRIAEAARQGFTRCLVPEACGHSLTFPRGMEVVAVSSLSEALRTGLKGRLRRARADAGESSL